MLKHRLRQHAGLCALCQKFSPRTPPPSPAMRRCSRLLQSSVAAAASVASTVPPMGTHPPRPLLASQFRVILREMHPHELPAATPSSAVAAAAHASSSAAANAAPAHSSTSELRQRFRSLLTLPAPSIPLAAEDSVAEPAHRTGGGLKTALGNALGLTKNRPVVAVVSKLQAHCAVPDWELHCGFQPASPWSRVHLRALHLWLLHVRLRSPIDEAESSNPPSHPYLQSLFETFWIACRPLFASQHEMALAHADVYKGWTALDEGLVELLSAQAKAEDMLRAAVASNQSEASSTAVDLTSITAPTLFSAAFHGRTPPTHASDRKLYTALWRHTFRGDAALNPLHLSALARYVLASLEMLQAIPLSDVMSGEFEWSAPPLQGPPRPLTNDEKAFREEYFKLLAPEVFSDRASWI